MSYIERSLEKIAALPGECPGRAAVKRAFAELEAYVASVIPAHIVGEPDRADAMNVIDDLQRFADKVDKVVSAYGDYAVFALGLNHKSITLFRDQLKDALEGNGLFALSEVGEEIEESRRERCHMKRTEA